MDVVDNYRLKLGKAEYVPIVTGGMGVDISTTELALVSCRLGGIGHISDAMVPFVSDKKFDTKFTQIKSRKYKETSKGFDKSTVKFDLDDIRKAQMNHVQSTIEQKQGSGAIHINVMEKLNMAAPLPTMQARLTAALDAGIDGITLSAGLHMHSMKLMENNPRFRDANIGIIVSGVRALKIFLRSAQRSDRFPDYIVVEGPLAGGHLGFGDDWQEYTLKGIVSEVLEFLKKQDLDIPVIPAGGVFTGTDAVEFLQSGSAAVQVATRFTVTEECGLPAPVKQKYFAANEEDVIVSCVSPTGYPIRMLTNSPCLNSNIKPSCEALGYILDKDGHCQYLTAYEAAPLDASGKKVPIEDKICLCHHFGQYNCYTCGHYVYRLSDTTIHKPDGSYQLLSAEHVFKDYQFSKEHSICLPSANAAA
ncbi:nitronate monooxygenase [Oligoflexia bacterium]|nr:nitronate monooxygenase [Oligoflexia bacterium]